MIDAHTHLDVRSYEDIEKMAIAGIEYIVTLAHDPYKMISPEVYLDHWDRIVNFEVKRGEMAGVNVLPGIGIHPMGYPKDWKILIKKIPEYIDKIVCIGETGLHYLKGEEELLKEQLILAKEYEKPIVIHTPEKNKKEALLRILDILNEVRIDESLVLIDHINRETIDLIDRDVYVGLSIQPAFKLSVKEACEIVRDYDKKFILSSDLGSLKSDIYALPKAKLEMKRMNLEKRKIEESLYKNAKKFYRI
ncbi:TatD-related deoxyribonuclease [Methanocaldococcus infernus ME]|uniref:TatD-related deoxyribonuclease n=1 Tax=Methanocaldococcus infernus (strain DSM 11812 / JCM 15783 / ME) TaxID=573063 RepID=D5VT36_METIM|nr:TatD family hydrolase [Methanocaldococcus infernus]ADG13739.1 TatD-related deoxyribonuclease [Methanocaldococcus infernus ME]